MTTKLTRFKVYNFRSIEESDWIEAADNSCLVGTNEAGKTNLLLALWKLNPANDEPIVPLDDFPRHLYSNYKADGHSNDVFIAADFLLGDTIQQEIAEELKCDIAQIKTSLVKRKYDGKYYISFPYSKIDSFPSNRIKTLIESFKNILEEKEAFTKESDELKETINTFLENELLLSKKKMSFRLMCKELSKEQINFRKITLEKNRNYQLFSESF